MADFLKSIFTCCLKRKRQHKQEIVDEESRLIPPPMDPSLPPLPGVAVVDQQKLKARLNTIVRSKEGKMVNVNARLPFNLHNKALSHTLDAHTAASSSSRSASLSIHSHPKPSPSPLSNTPHTHTQVHAHVGAPLSFDVPANASSTRSSSRDGADLDVYTRSRILNLRLVQRNGVGRRGRSRIKPVGEERAAAPEGGGGVSPDPGEGSSRGAVPHIDFSAVPSRPADDLYSPVSTVMEGTPRATVPLHNLLSTSPQQQRPSVSIASPSAFDFKIQDAGAICISWGD